MVKEVTRLVKVWSDLLNYILASQKVYYNYSQEELQWLVNNLLNLFLEAEDFPPETTYRCLVYLNRNIKYGRYNLLFNKNINLCTINKDVDGLREVCIKAEFQELASLEKSTREQWEQEIQTEMLVYNLYTDREIVGASPEKIKRKLAECYDEAISFKTNKIGRYIISHNESVIYLSETGDRLVITPMREIDLIYILLTNNINPYTGNPIKEETRSLLMGKYHDIILICREAVRLSYKHEYKL